MPLAQLPPAKKFLPICPLLDSWDLTPKALMLLFLKHKNIYLAYLRRLWVSACIWDLTMKVLIVIKEQLVKKFEGWMKQEHFWHLPTGKQKLLTEADTPFLHNLILST
ncbi:hypothetical protein VP01_2326g1 [Puccinia sorghi]|uniref:Uncharacterized protein n=1 Tax=Puccinia sorghi TaxID=27349 RepID=A0A0L6V7Q3_9BASI|nr:hypothetical protein VP01_2326g1 [Puccinia sorghi]